MNLDNVPTNWIDGTFAVAIIGASFYYFGTISDVKGDDKNRYLQAVSKLNSILQL